MPGAGHSRGRREPALEAAVRSCVTIPVRRRRARQDSATGRRCVCGPARYRRIPIKGFYSQARALRNWMRSRDASGAHSTRRAGPESSRSARGIRPTRVREPTRSDGQCSASGSRDRQVKPRSRLDLPACKAARRPVAWTMHDTLSRCQAAHRNPSRYGRVEAHGGEA